MRKFVLSIALALFLPACASEDSQSPEDSNLVRSGARAWVATEPTQCLTNPWEVDWLARHNGDEAAYPRDLSTWPRQLTPEEMVIITEYYEGQGVVVFETGTREKSRSVCAACECEEGHTLYLLVRERDVEKMIGFGYRREAPQN